MIKLTKKFIIPGAIAAALIFSSASVWAVSRHKNTPSQVKGASTTAEKPKSAPQPEAATETITESATTSQQTDQPKTTPTNKTQSTTKTTTPADTTPNPEPVAAQITPETQPVTPPGQPGFTVVFRTNDYRELDVPYNPAIHQVYVPFDLVYDEGFEKVNYQQSFCAILEAPSAANNVYCELSEKDENTRGIVFQYSNDSPLGSYILKLTYNINGTQSIAGVEIIL